MNYARLTAVLALSLCPLVSASAQSDSASATKIEPPKWSLSLGVDPTRFDPGSYHSRFVGNLTRSWQKPGSRFSREVSLAAGTYTPRGYSCYGCWSSRSEQYLGLTGGASAELFHLWRFTPYVHGGAGLYYTRFHASSGTAPIVLSPAQLTTNNFSFGLNGGFGIRARILSHELFIDQTLHTFDVRALNQGMYPLSIGIRF